MTQDAPAANPSSPQLLWAEDGSPRSGRFGDVYFSKDDGLAETRAVFLDGCNMPAVWQGRTRFTVAELGFGTGLNIIALIELWRRTRETGAQLNIFTVEGYPLTRDEAARALSAWPDVAETAEALLARWPSSRPGFHRIDLPQWGVTLDIAIGEVGWALDNWQGKADAWFLDGFSPALNPRMWSEEIMAQVAAHSASGCHLATFTVAGVVRRALAANGFAVSKMPGHGRKRERLEARLVGTPTALRAPRIAVIGGGIAGASVIRALTALGLTPTLIEAEQAGAGASGFPASLVTPRMDAGDDFIAGLYAQCLARADSLYAAIDGAVLARGVVQLENMARDAARFDKISAQPLWPDGAMQRLTPEQASDLTGEPVERGGLLMRGALALSPRAVLATWLADVPVVKARVTALLRQDDEWHLQDEAGTVIFRADHVVIAAGWGSAALMPQLALSPVAGQADWAVLDGAAPRPVAWGGYSVPTPDGLLFGATHDRGVTDPAPDADASARNLETLASALPACAAAVSTAPRHARTAVRATTPDRLPLCGTLQDGLHVLGGMGSRGFCASPLLGEHLAATIAGAPSPLPRRWAEKLRPR